MTTLSSTRARKTTEAGFSAFLKGEESDASDDETPESAFDVLQALRTGQTGSCDAVTVNEKKTTPPPLFTEATLLAALVRVADFVEDARIKQLLKDKDKDKKDEHSGIGTPATRSDMLEKLKSRQFIRALPESATLPDMTALWSAQQSDIEQGNKTVDEFINELIGELQQQVNNVSVGQIKGEAKSSNGQVERLATRCPNCGKDIVVRPKLFTCTGCDFKIWSTVAEKKLTTKQVGSLINKGKRTLN